MAWCIVHLVHVCGPIGALRLLGVVITEQLVPGWTRFNLVFGHSIVSCANTRLAPGGGVAHLMLFPGFRSRVRCLLLETSDCLMVFTGKLLHTGGGKSVALTVGIPWTTSVCRCPRRNYYSNKYDCAYVHFVVGNEGQCHRVRGLALGRLADRTCMLRPRGLFPLSAPQAILLDGNEGLVLHPFRRTHPSGTLLRACGLAIAYTLTRGCFGNQCRVIDRYGRSLRVSAQNSSICVFMDQQSERTHDITMFSYCRTRAPSRLLTDRGGALARVL